MLLVISLLILSVIAEFGIHFVPRSHSAARFLLILIGVILVVFCSELALYAHPSLATVLFALLGIYRLFNLGRIEKGRMHAAYLRRTTRLSTVWLGGFQVISLALLSLSHFVHAKWSYISLLTGLTLILLCTFTAERLIARQSRRMRLFKSDISTDLATLPSITIAIPARNETEELAACIESILGSQYPKLEILVLDDCSQSPRPAEIIKSFAHQGVRFIQGEQPSDTWLAKNQAYAKLAREASGDYIVFCGVDVRVSPNTLRQLLQYMTSRGKDMVSVMPENVSSWAPALIQPMRYLWEIGLPRKHLGRPPVLSSFWIISKSALLRAGGFEATRRMVVPESYLARIAANNDAYGFISGGTSIGLRSNKSPYEQRATAIRVAYPQLHRRPEIVVLVSLALTAWISLPAYAVLSITSHPNIVALIFALSIILLSIVMYARLLKIAYNQVRVVSLLLFPAAIIWYVILLNYSMYKYEFSEVEWKGRNVCIPVMHVVPHLPKV